MFLKDSRYKDCNPFNPDTSYKGVRSRSVTTADGVLEHTVKSGERLDQLARYYYNNDRLWWRILDANPHIAYGGDLMLDEYQGEIILIPRERD